MEGVANRERFPLLGLGRYTHEVVWEHGVYILNTIGAKVRSDTTQGQYITSTR